MTGKKFNVSLIEYPKTVLYYDYVTIDTADYPELNGKSDQEIINYIKENAWSMKSTDPDIFDSLGEEISDMDVVKEKNPSSETDVDVSLSSDNQNED